MVSLVQWGPVRGPMSPLSLTALAMLLLAGPTVLTGAEPAAGWLPATAYAVPKHTAPEGEGYFSIIEGRNERLYIGTHANAVNSWLVEFEPKSEQLKIVVDAHQAIGTNATGFASQSKIHTRNNVGRSGKIYFGTKQGYPAAGEKREDYPGGYPMVYDPKTGETTVYPIPVPHQGINSIAPDESRGLAYVSTCADHRPGPGENAVFLVLDLETKKYTQLIDTEHFYGFIVVDYRGRAYHPLLGGDIARYDPETGKLDRLKQTIDGKPPTEKTRLARTPKPDPINWDISPDRKTLYAQAMRENAIYAYDLTADGDTLPGRRIGTVIPGAGDEEVDCRALGVGPSGDVWSATTAPGERGVRLLHLVRYRPGDKAPRDLGVVYVENPGFTEFTQDDGKPLPFHGGFATLENGKMSSKHVILGVCEGSNGDVYMLALQPYTVLRVRASELQKKTAAHVKPAWNARVEFVSQTDASSAWPPALPRAKEGTVTLRDKSFLNIPESVAAQEQAAPSFELARQPPTVHLAYHQQLGPDAVNRRLWSSWGDIGVAPDGRVYSAIGDHGNAVGGDARCFVYEWDPQHKRLRQVVDMNQVIPPDGKQPAWSKVHAKIDALSNGKVYFSCTLNDGNRAGREDYHWNDRLPGGQLYEYDPATGKTTLFANLPPRRCTATSLFDAERNRWWCNLEAGDGNALWALDFETRKPVFQSADGAVSFNRNFALTRDGSILFNGPDADADEADKKSGRIWKWDSSSGAIKATGSRWTDSAGMRCSTRESREGKIYGVTHGTSQLFVYDVTRDHLELLGPNWGSDGSYTTVCVLSPDERFVYYLPGSHGKAYLAGTPVVQWEPATGRRKVLAFLAPTVERATGYVPAGSYGVKMSADGSSLYVNFNGHAADRLRPSHMRANGFGLCAFAEIEIPESER